MASHHTLEARTHGLSMGVPFFDTSMDSLDFLSALTYEPSPRYCFSVPLKSVRNGGLLILFEYKRILKKSGNPRTAKPRKKKENMYLCHDFL
jgi:hypothetical protein